MACQIFLNLILMGILVNLSTKKLDMSIDLFNRSQLRFWIAIWISILTTHASSAMLYYIKYTAIGPGLYITGAALTVIAMVLSGDYFDKLMTSISSLFC